MDSHALATLRYIRSSMEAAATVAVPGSAGIAVGAIGLAAAALSAEAFHAYWLVVWLCAAAGGALAGALLVARQGTSQGRFTLFGAPVRKVFMHLLPSIFAGAVLTVVLLRSGNQHVIPGTWLLLYGCALLYASAVTSRMIAVLGALFVVLAVVAFVIPAQHQMALLGIGFGELHILYGAVMSRSGHAVQA